MAKSSTRKGEAVFAPKVTKPQAKATAESTNRLSNRPVKQALMLQSTVGNQAMLRLLAQRGFSPLREKVGDDHEQEGGTRESTTTREAPRGVAWDFSNIPVFSPDRASRPQPSSPFAATPLPGAIQAKLAVGQVNDPLEHEADRVADQVVRMPAPNTLAAPRAAVGAPSVVQVHEVLRSPGQPLDVATRAYFEPRFGRDFSGVRVHTGAAAEQSARDVNARAYTVGRDLVFDAGRFAPGTQEGRHLIAHELTHVVQQSGMDGIRVGQSDNKRGQSNFPASPNFQRSSLDFGMALQRAPIKRPDIKPIPTQRERTTGGAAAGAATGAGIGALGGPPGVVAGALIGGGAGAATGAVTTSPATRLLAASKEEMAYAGPIEGFAAYAPQKDWEEYSFTTLTINSYIDLADAGYPPDASEWHRALNEVGEARNQLCSNAEVELNQRISARAAHLEADKRDLAAALAAVKAVEEAEQVAEEAEHRAKWLEAMKILSEVVEVIGNPHDFLEAETGFAIERVTHIALAASTLKADFGSFIRAETQYMVQVTLAAHNFGSTEEMERRVTTASGNVEATAQDLHSEVYARNKARTYHAKPIHH
jgi:Domain of unknown function (DUF4157)